jgi:hypothetical protein
MAWFAPGPLTKQGGNIHFLSGFVRGGRNHQIGLLIVRGPRPESNGCSAKSAPSNGAYRLGWSVIGNQWVF